MTAYGFSSSNFIVVQYTIQYMRRYHEIMRNFQPFLAWIIFVVSSYLKSIFDIPKLRQNCPGQDEPSQDCNKPFPCSFCLVGLWPKPNLGHNISLLLCNCSSNSERNPENDKLLLHLGKKKVKITNKKKYNKNLFS